MSACGWLSVYCVRRLLGWLRRGFHRGRLADPFINKQVLRVLWSCFITLHLAFAPVQPLAFSASDDEEDNFTDINERRNRAEEIKSSLISKVGFPCNTFKCTFISRRSVDFVGNQKLLTSETNFYLQCVAWLCALIHEITIPICGEAMVLCLGSP